MAHNPILAVFLKLLELCRRYARNGLRLLLRIFSLLAKRVGSRRPVSPGKPKEDDSAIKGRPDVRSSGASTEILSPTPSSSIPTERTVVVACSTAPTTPPKAKTRHIRSSSEPFGSITSQLISASPTFVESPTSESGYDVGKFCSSPERYGSMYSASPSLASIEENKEVTFVEGGILASPVSREGTFVVGSEAYAEPAGMGAKSGEGQRKNIEACAPSERPRYDRNIAIGNKNKGWKFKPLQTYDLFRDHSVNAWKYFIHPEGIPYYLYVASPGFSFLTEANLKDSATLGLVETFMNDLEDRIEKFDWKGRRPQNMEVVLELEDGRDKRDDPQKEDCWTYYMVDLDNRVVFWVDEYDISINACGSAFGYGEFDHFISQLDFEYWVHIEHFPNHRDVPMKWFGEALGILNHWRIDVISSADSTAPYDQHDLQSIINSIHQLESTMKEGYNHAYALAALARVMSIAANDRHRNVYGSPGARLQVWQSVRGQINNQRLWLVKYMSPILFYAPETHLSGLKKQWVDGVLQERRWKKYQLKLERDWESFVITSTVLLNANVALLSTPIILSDNDDGILFASPAAVASQVSIVASIASIIIGLLLIRQIRISSKDIEITASDAMEYLSRREHAQLGVETMAIQYSLPYAFLMWAMVTFLTSIAIACFFGIDGWPNTLVKLIYALAWLFIIPLILWTVITGWETTSHTHIADLLSRRWWLGLIKGLDVKLEMKKFLTRLTRRKRKGKTTTDAGAIEMGGHTTTTPEPITPTTNESEDTTLPNERKNPEQRNWRVRVKNFGPVRRLTLALAR